jgi:hypothetical protein
MSSGPNLVRTSAMKAAVVTFDNHPTRTYVTVPAAAPDKDDIAGVAR